MRQFLRSIWKTAPMKKLGKGKRARRRRTLDFNEAREGLATGKLTTYYPQKGRPRLVMRHGRLRVVTPKKEATA